MKPFSLQEFKKNPSRKIVTRDGKATARIICTDCKSEYPIIALLSYSENSEGCEAYTEDGRFSIDGEGNSDLFFAPEKKEGWLNVYKIADTDEREASYIFNTKEEAELYRGVNPKCVATLKITWEE